MSAQSTYVRYSDDLEVIQPNEEAIIQETMESMARQAQKVFEQTQNAKKRCTCKKPWYH